MAEEQKKERGLRAVKVNLTPVKDKTIGEIFGTEEQPITELNKKMWAMIKSNNLRTPPK